MRTKLPYLLFLALYLIVPNIKATNPQLHITVTGPNNADQTWVGFNPAATAGFDISYDANKSVGTLTAATLFSTINDTTWMSVNTLQSIAQSPAVPMGIEPGKTGSFTFAFDQFNTFDSTTYIFLEDKQQNIPWYNVRSGSFTFHADSSEAWNRFILHFTPPVEIDTSASCVGLGTITIIQNGTPVWHYTLRDSTTHTVLDTGTISQSSPATISIAPGLYSLVLKDSSGYSVTKKVRVGTGNGSSILPAVSITPSATTACSGSMVTFNASPGNGGGAPTYNFFKNGSSVQNGSSSSYQSSILINNDSVWVVMTSSSPCASPTTATSAKVHMTINGTVTPSIGLSPSATSVCTGTQVTFTTKNAVNAGTLPTYTFYKDGISVQSGLSNSYHSSSLINNDSIWVVMTSSASCPSPSTATSTKIHMTIASTIAPAISISATDTTICTGTQVTFTAINPVNPGSSPVYGFYKNGISVQSSSSTTYTNNSLHTNDSIWIKITSNASCASPTVAISAKIHMIVNTAVAPSIGISPSATTVCSGTPVTFTANNPVNQGGAPTYNFYKNGISVQNSLSNSYQFSSLNNDSVWVVMTSNASCASPTTATSPKVHMTVSVPVTPSIGILPSATTICAGTPVIFTANNPVNQGGSPTYNFFKNGALVQSGSLTTYSNSSLINNDSVWVKMVSNANCASPDTVTSPKVYMLVSSTLVPSIDISPSSTTICAGTQVTFTANNPVNQGGAPTYNFYKNGTSVQNNSSNIYQNSSLINNDSIWVVMTSNASCTSPSTASSSKVYMTVNTIVTPLVSITPSATTTCPGLPVNFTALPTYGGTSPTYNFYVDGTSVQNSISDTYHNSLLSNNDSVWVIMTSNSACASAPTASSSKVYMTVGHLTTVTIDTNMCGGNSFFFNNVNLTHSGTYRDTTTAVGGCDSITTLVLTVFSKPSPAIIKHGNDTLITTTAFVSYQWLRNGTAINNATAQMYVATQDGSYSVLVTDANGCTDTALAVTLQEVSVNDISDNAIISLFPNPTSGYFNIRINGIHGKLLNMQLYDVYGNIVRNINEEIPTDSYSSDLNLSQYANGIYFLHLQFDNVNVSRRIELVK